MCRGSSHRSVWMACTEASLASSCLSSCVFRSFDMVAQRYLLLMDLASFYVCSCARVLLLYYFLYCTLVSNTFAVIL